MGVVCGISTGVNNLISLYKNISYTNEHENVKASTLTPFISVKSFNDNKHGRTWTDLKKQGMFLINPWSHLSQQKVG